MSSGYDVDIDELSTASGAITDAVAPATKLVLEHADADAYGHPTAHGAAQRFCTTWQVGIALLAARAESASKALASAAETYAADDETAGGNFQSGLGYPYE